MKALGEALDKIPEKTGTLPSEEELIKQGFDPDTYYHVTREDIKKFNPNEPADKGLGPKQVKDWQVDGFEGTRGATYFTASKDYLEEIFDGMSDVDGGLVADSPNKGKGFNFFSLSQDKQLGFQTASEIDGNPGQFPLLDSVKYAKVYQYL